MIKNLLQKELQNVLDCTSECAVKYPKKIFIYSCIYCLILFLTFIIVIGLSANNFLSLSAIFGFLLMVEIIFTFYVFNFIVFLGLAYYGAYFTRKGWDRKPSTSNDLNQFPT